MDDWKSSYLPRLERSYIYSTLKLRCIDKDNDVIALAEQAVEYAVQRTKTVIRHMGEFTLHDEDHLFRVLHLMERILQEENIKALTTPELLMLILTAFFHDIGMSPSEKDVLVWKKVWDVVPELNGVDEEKSFNEFKRFCSARPGQMESIQKLLKQGNFSAAETMKSYVVTEFIRQSHADRARDIIETDWKDKIKYRDNDLTVEFAQICYSHNEEASTLLDLDKNYLCGPNEYACLPLVGVVLRLADILNFDGKRTPSILFSHLYVRHPISIQEWNKHRAIEAWEITPEIIQFSAQCSHPAIQASINEFCNLIDSELSICNNISTIVNEFNHSKGRQVFLKLPFKVDREKIRTKKDIKGKPLYIYQETQFNLSKRQVIDLLMGTKLYGNPEVALRELLQNSVDACLLRSAQEKKWGNLYEPEITVRYYHDQGEDILEVIDNGTGMDQYIIDNYYSKVGSSFYKSTDFYNLRSESSADFTPTSRFGIGILSSFMVADTLIVDTRRVYGPHKSSDALNITVEGQESIFWVRPGYRDTPGTTTKLILRKSVNPWEKMSEEKFIESVENVIPNPPFKIHIQTTSSSSVRDEHSFEKVTASSLKDHSWNDNDNIQTFQINLNNKDQGIIGSALIGVLVEHGIPVGVVDVHSKSIEIEGIPYSLEKRLQLEENKIINRSTSITINDNSEINQENSTQHLSTSKSRISLHGIEVPSTLFPEYWIRKANQVKLSWPVPLILVIDISGMNDLDLNSSRTEIIMSDKWLRFEETLVYEIFNEVSKQVSTEYWEALVDVMLKNTKNEQFINGLTKIVKL